MEKQHNESLKIEPTASASAFAAVAVAGVVVLYLLFRFLVLCNPCIYIMLAGNVKTKSVSALSIASE